MHPHGGASAAGTATATPPTACEDEGPGTPARVTVGGMLFAVQTECCPRQQDVGLARGAAFGQQAVASRPLKGRPPGAA